MLTEEKGKGLSYGGPRFIFNLQVEVLIPMKKYHYPWEGNEREAAISGQM